MCSYDNLLGTKYMGLYDNLLGTNYMGLNGIKCIKIDAVLKPEESHLVETRRDNLIFIRKLLKLEMFKLFSNNGILKYKASISHKLNCSSFFCFFWWAAYQNSNYRNS
ncbi:hypothetical protein BpHYR1_019035 [Brachionus plicatilis]|uniref:Uncharacterized protein n=1 Tax=Brachionus plicatilis TaxID=10195 RepID=A0A3M7SFU6_BRAPC|nr:hypothetical protein BpHYR1_019035 [Brachionus plicatilis]